VARPSGTLDELVAVGRAGARLHVRCSGSGDTTVVLISGFEGGGDIWGAVTPDISRQARVCSYDRFGTGTSDPSSTTQTFASQAQDLRALLQAIGEPAPYVVVGHSFGGAEAVSFASSFPADVSGLLLLDASPISWPAAVCSVSDDGSDAARDFQAACAMQTDPANNVEHLDALAAFGEVAGIDTLGAVPMIVTTAADHPYAGLTFTETARLDEVWNAGQQHWLSLSSSAQLVSVADTSHDIQLDQPELVIDQIRQLLP
jgi:pimeloyl-ACP methyl ester carboxylesterase